MNLYEEGLSHLFGFRPRKKVMKRVVVWTLAFTSVATPITFRHAILDYSQRRTTMVMKWVINPEVHAMTQILDKQMHDAQLRQQRQLHQK